MQWYEESFGNDYLTVYKHRDHNGALEEVKRISSWLRLPKGAEVLDLCCGMGRHSMALHDLGYKVTSLDLSDVLLAEARRTDVRSRIQWVKGDMRRLSIAQPFDAIFNLFTSFGYFDDDKENLAVLKEIHKNT
jgi:ubiquinone/menaquinone biosynthesis C-methylase UbiE